MRQIKTRHRRRLSIRPKLCVGRDNNNEPRQWRLARSSHPRRSVARIGLGSVPITAIEFNTQL